MWLQDRLWTALLVIAYAIMVASTPGFGANAGGTRPALDELLWIDRSADRVAHLTRAPAECLEAPSDPSSSARVALGRMAFRSPVLLGGIAARSGMSCNTCHRSGQGNPDFFVASVSDEAGRVDVTGGIFSQNRDDGVFNPRVIPSLLDVASKSSFGTAVPSGNLRDFVLTVVVDEFQGQMPPDAVTEGLLAYLARLRSSACPQASDEENDVATDFAYDVADVFAAYEVAAQAIERDDTETADFALLAIKALLGRVYTRFPPSEAAREGLIESSTALTPIRGMLDSDPKQAVRALDTTRRELQVKFETLRERAGESYYDAAVLERALLGTR